MNRKMLNIRLPAGDLEMIKERAGRAGMTVQQYVHEVLMRESRLEQFMLATERAAERYGQALGDLDQELDEATRQARGSAA